MKKIITLLTTATFFALSCSLIDCYIWNNNFSIVNMFVGFIAGAALVLLSDSNKKSLREIEH